MNAAKKRVLTGVKPTGIPHIGNYLGAIRPALKLSEEFDSFLFLADLHALTTHPDPKTLREETYAVAAAWLSLGLNPEKTVFYRQSDIPEIPMLTWVLSCNTTMGLLQRGTSYKDAVAKAKDAGDTNHGLFSYPVLMAADILCFDADVVPVGKDQKQHLEIAQEAARKVNNRYGNGEELIRVPEARIDEAVMTVPGLDGQKMSKSYGNTITPFEDQKSLKKNIKRIKTDSTEYGEPLPTEGSVILALHKLLANGASHKDLVAQFEKGRKDPSLNDADLEDATSNYFGWGDAKKALLGTLVDHFAEARAEYSRLMDDKAYLDKLLLEGAEKARKVSRPTLKRVLEATGITARLPS